MPHYNLNNTIYWFDSEEEAAIYQPTALLITDEEADAIRTDAQAKAQAEYEASLTYAQKRQAAYPPMQDYIDGLVKGDQAQMQAYIDKCLAIKAQFPKETI